MEEKRVSSRPFSLKFDSLKKAKKGVENLLSPKHDAQRKNTKSALEELRSPRSKKDKTKELTPEDAVHLKNELIEQDKPSNLSCFSVGALVEFQGESGHLRGAEEFLRAFRSKMAEECSQPIMAGADISLREAIEALSSEPFASVPQLDKARKELAPASGQRVAPERGMRILEAAIAEVAARRDPQYGQDLQAVNGLIKVREYIGAGIAGLLSSRPDDESLRKSSVGVMKFIKSSIPPQVLESPNFKNCLKRFSDHCNRSDSGKSAAENYKDALIELHQDVRSCFPRHMNPEWSMSPKERDAWVGSALIMLTAPLKGATNRDALQAAYGAMKKKDTTAINTEHTMLSGSFRLVGLYSQSVLSIVKGLPTSERSNVKMALKNLEDATIRHNKLIKKYGNAGRCSSEEAMNSFDVEKYDAAVTELRTLSVDLFRAVGLTEEDVDVFNQRQNESKSTDKARVKEDERVLRQLLDELQ